MLLNIENFNFKIFHFLRFINFVIVDLTRTYFYIATQAILNLNKGKTKLQNLIVYSKSHFFKPEHHRKITNNIQRLFNLRKNITD